MGHDRARWLAKGRAPDDLPNRLYRQVADQLRHAGAGLQRLQARASIIATLPDHVLSAAEGRELEKLDAIKSEEEAPGFAAVLPFKDLLLMTTRDRVVGRPSHTCRDIAPRRAPTSAEWYFRDGERPEAMDPPALRSRGARLIRSWRRDQASS